MFNNQLLFHKDWYDSGIHVIYHIHKDLVGRNGHQSMENIFSVENVFVNDSCQTKEVNLL